MSNYDTKQVNFFKVPKKLFHNQIFKNSTPNEKLIVIHLISLSESFGKSIFWQKPIDFCKHLNINKATLYRSQKRLAKLGIKITGEDKLWNFNMISFLNEFIEYKDFLRSLQNVS